MSPPRTVLFLGAPPRLSPRENLRVLHRARLQSDTIPIGVGVVLIDVERDPRGALVEAARNWREAPRILVLPPGHPYRADLVGLCDTQVHPPATAQEKRIPRNQLRGPTLFFHEAVGTFEGRPMKKD